MIMIFDHDINIAMAALIGMAAMFAGASRALLTSIVFALETTRQSNALLPLLAACLAAYFISFFLMKGSIMTEKIIRRGVKTPDAFEPDLLQNITVQQLLSSLPPDINNLPVVYATDDVGFAAEMMGKYNTGTLLVMGNKLNKNPAGVITSASILEYYSDQKQKQHTYDSPGRTKRLMVRGRKLWQRSR